MPPFDTRLCAADLEWASLASICFYAPAASIHRAPLATTELIASRQSDRRGPAVWKARNARERARRRFLRDASVLILGLDWEAQPLPGARARVGAAGDRRRDAWATRPIRGNLMKKVSTIFIKKEEPVTEAEAIAKRIESFGARQGLHSRRLLRRRRSTQCRQRARALACKGRDRRAIRGVYYAPERSALMGTEVPASADEVVRAVARANKWIVAPSGDAALNALGLDTQVPAKLVYVSSGPYKRYEYGPYDIELRHRANRDLLDCSQITCTIVQALKALGRENVGDEEIGTLARNLTEEQAGAFLEESAGLTSWVADAAKKIWEAKHGQDR